jgi:hypothetical protein
MSGLLIVKRNAFLFVILNALMSPLVWSATAEPGPAAICDVSLAGEFKAAVIRECSFGFCASNAWNTIRLLKDHGMDITKANIFVIWRADGKSLVPRNIRTETLFDFARDYPFHFIVSYNGKIIDGTVQDTVYENLPSYIQEAFPADGQRFSLLNQFANLFSSSPTEALMDSLVARVIPAVEFFKDFRSVYREKRVGVDTPMMKAVVTYKRDARYYRYNWRARLRHPAKPLRFLL